LKEFVLTNARVSNVVYNVHTQPLTVVGFLFVSFFGIFEVAHEGRPVVLQEVIVHCLI